MKLCAVHMDSPLVGPLLEGLGQEYRERYGSGNELASTTPTEFEPPAGAFVVLVDDSGTVAGGGIRRIDEETCELKRLWTRADRRREGLAGQVIDALEATAVAAGYSRLILETGPAQPEAEAFYERRGYIRIPVYGHYEHARAFERHIGHQAAEEIG
jgi:GNAT superfamily N-acetyltransferase